ncbi:MAG: hypothetical protein WKF77_13715 [Planctomycetaceae bacterium]
MSDRWYYQLLLEEFGPVSEEYILELLTCGTLGEGDLVRSEAGGDWMLISAMKESCQASDSSESMLEEIQDLSELNFKFATSSSAPGRSTLAANTPVQSPRSDTLTVPKPSIPTRGSKVAVRTEAPVRKRTAEPVEAKTAMPASPQQKPAVANGKRKRVASDKETSKVGRSKRISSNGTGVDDDLPDDVFNDVSQKQDSTSQRSLSATASMATSPTSAGLAGTAASRGAMGTQSSISSNAGYSTGASSSPTPVSALYSASRSMPTAPPRMAYTPPPKKSVSVSEPMDVKKVGTVAGAITVIAGVLAISIFGLPFGGGGRVETPFDPKATAAVLKTILKNFDDLTMTTDETAFDECMDNVKPQMAAIMATTQDPKNNTPEAAACQAATKALMKIADSFPDKQEEIQQGVIEFQMQIALVQ